MIHRVFLLLVTILLFLSSSAQKDTCLLGVYVNSIYDFKPEDKSYMADFWMWLNYRNENLNFENSLEVPNSKSVDFSHYSLERKKGINWTTQKGRAQVIYEWDLSKFPFDKQRLQIEIEDSQYDTSRVIFVADQQNSKIDTAFNSNEWIIEDFKIVGGIKTYETSYGNPMLNGTSSYPRVLVEILIRRNNSWLMLFKMLTGAYVAFLISSLVFFISSENQDSRFGLCVGGLFAAIGNKYIVESVVPSSTTYTLMDNVHNLTFTFILLIVIVSIVSLHYFESGDTLKHKRSLKMDMVVFYSIVASYIAVNVFLVMQALN